MSAPPGARRLRIALAGEEGAGLAALRAIEASGHCVAMVLTSSRERARGRGSAIWAHALESGHPLHEASCVTEPRFASVLEHAAVDLLLNVHSLHIVAEPVLAAPRLGCFNMHPGPLPRYAGLHAPSWALLRGETQHGVTVHRMSGRVDTGSIAYQATFPLGDRDTAFSVSLRCVEAGLPLLDALVAAAASDPASIPAIPQDLSQREYFGRAIPEGGVIAWARTALEISRFVRAFSYHPFPSPWGDPKTTRDGREVGIVSVSLTGEPTSARPGSVAVGPTQDEVRVACGDAWIRIDRAKIDGKRVPASAVLADGDDLGA